MILSAKRFAERAPKRGHERECKIEYKLAYWKDRSNLGSVIFAIYQLLSTRTEREREGEGEEQQMYPWVHKRGSGGIKLITGFSQSLP